MTAWPQAQLKDVAFFQEGPGLRNWQWAEDGIKVINGRNVLVDGQIDLSNTDKFVSWEEFHSKYKHFEVQANDIVVTSSGTLGKVGRIRPEHLPLMMNTSVIRFRPNDSGVLNDGFLFAYLRSPLFQEKVTAYAIGAAQPNFGPSHLKLFSIPLPPIGVQNRIAGILSAYDELIENSQRRIKILELMARALYREWFVHFRFPGHESVPRVPSPLGEIPQGWEVTTLGSLVDIRKGKNITKDTIRTGDVPVVAGGMAPAYFHDTANTRSPVITISASGANAGFVNLYYADVWASDCSYIDMAATPHVVYFYLWLDHRRPAVTHLQRGSAQPHVYPKDLALLEALRVPERLLRAFGLEVGPVFDLTMRLTAKVDILRRTRDLLLPRLLSGQIDVEAMPS